MANGQGSAGVAIREYEVTGPVGTPPPLGIPAGVIGTALRGPAFVPVTLGSGAAFRLKFGGTDGKKFGPLAINEWMVNSGGRAATYLRVLGAGDCRERNEDGTVTSAGFVVGSQLPSGSAGTLANNPFATGDDLGRTYFLGGLMVDADGSDLLSSAGQGWNMTDYDTAVNSTAEGVWAAGGLDSDVPDATKGYTIRQKTFKFSEGLNREDLGTGFQAKNGDTILHIRCAFTGASGPSTIGESLLKFDLGTSDSFTPGTEAEGVWTAGQISASSNPDVGNLMIRFNYSSNSSIVYHRFDSSYTQTGFISLSGSPVLSSFTGTDTLDFWVNKTQFSDWAESKTWSGSTPTLSSFKDSTKTIIVPEDDGQDFSKSYILLNTVAPAEIPVVRGVLMAPSGVLLDLKENNDPTPTFGDDAGLVDSNQGFVLRLNGYNSGSASIFVSASFDPTSDSYFAKVLNTDPLKIQERGHYLYASWDVHPGLSIVSGSCFILNGSEDHNTGSSTVPNFEGWEDRFSHPVTPWVVSQKFGTEAQNLFRLHSLDDGEGAATTYKFSIENLVPGNPEIAGGYGAFDLLVRDWNDTDSDPVVLESFKGLSLDSRSDKYVARVIGNSYRSFDFDRTESEQKLVDEIDHPMGSNLVRVEMATAVDMGDIDSSALPMGFRGVGFLNTRDTLSGDEILAPYISTPPVPMRFNLVVGTGTRTRLNSDLFWGMQFENITSIAQPNESPTGDLRLNGSLKAFAKFFPSHMVGQKAFMEKGNDSAQDAFCNNGFSLEKVFVVENASDTATIKRADPSKWSLAKYSRDASSLDGLRALKVNDLTLPKNRRHAKFTFIMQGGFNGVNIFNSDMADLTNVAVTQEINNEDRGRTEGPTVRAYLKSIEIMKNTVNSDLQLLAIPGIRNSSVTEVAADAVRDRFDALYLMDVEQKSTLLGEDELPQDVSEGEQDLDGGLRVSVAATVSHFEERDMDNSFAAAYFPDVVITDPGTGGNVTVPPSVVVLGAMALNDRVGHPWFAPAGVTRGALASTQRAKVSLSKANLDALYDVGINPLTPPSAGLPVTVWGQKTLQAGNSALNRVNVRRLLIEIRRQVRDIAQTIIFEPNRAATLARFTAAVTPRLQRIQALSGLDRFRVVIDSSTTTQQDVENNTIRGKIFVQPTKSIEYVSLDFVVSNSGAQV